MIKLLSNKKRIILKKQKQERNEARNPTSGRTKKEAAVLRDKCMIFLMFAGLKSGGIQKLQELGYDGYQNQDFMNVHGVSHNYFWRLQMRPDFKEKFFRMVTAYMAKDLMSYMQTLCYSKEASKAMQILFPEEVGRAMAQRTIGITGDSDDAGFRNQFFGMKKKKEKT